MHVEILVEDQSTKALLDIIVPKIIGENGDRHTWRMHPYKGLGRLPTDLRPRTDAAKRILLDQLPRLLRGFRNTLGVDYVVVVVDADDRDCRAFLRELEQVAVECEMQGKAMFRLAIEETEAWYLGDRQALLVAYPGAELSALQGYVQDSACGTWELLADAIHVGGAQAITQAGWPMAGRLKSEWAARIGPHIDPGRNASPSFQKLCEGLRRIAPLA